MAQRPACARRAAALIAWCLLLVVVASTAVQVAMITEGHHGNECCDDGLTALRSWVRGALPAYAATLKTPQLRCAGLPFSAQLQLSHRHASGVNAAFYVTENATLGVEVDGPLLKLQPSTQQFVWAHEISHCAAEVLLDKAPQASFLLRKVPGLPVVALMVARTFAFWPSVLWTPECLQGEVFVQGGPCRHSKAWPSPPLQFASSLAG